MLCSCYTLKASAAPLYDASKAVEHRTTAHEGEPRSTDFVDFHLQMFVAAVLLYCAPACGFFFSSNVVLFTLCSDGQRFSEPPQDPATRHACISDFKIKAAK
jgi:hypothetical protein